jgi:hypothetical protein
MWKQKAIERRLENKELNKRIKELKRSRDNWKNKYVDEKKITCSFKQELTLIKKKLTKIAIS